MIQPVRLNCSANGTCVYVCVYNTHVCIHVFTPAFIQSQVSCVHTCLYPSLHSVTGVMCAYMSLPQPSFSHRCHVCIHVFTPAFIQSQVSCVHTCLYPSLHSVTGVMCAVHGMPKLYSNSSHTSQGKKVKPSLLTQHTPLGDNVTFPVPLHTNPHFLLDR